MVDLEYENSKDEVITNNEIIKNTEKNKIAFFKALGILIFLTGIIILIVIKIQKPDFPLGAIFGIIIGLLIICLGLFFGFSYYRKKEIEKQNKSKDDTLPPPITIAQANEIRNEIFLQPDYADYIEEAYDTHIYVIGKNKKSRIYASIFKTVYESKPVFFAMNMHYPRELYSISYNINPSKMTKLINSLAVDPEESPETEVIETRNPLLGTEQKITKTIRPLKKENKKDKEKGDLQ